MTDIPPCLPDRVAGPDTIYSNLPGPVIQIDGACYSRRNPVETITNEDEVLVVSNGTNLNDCARVECGPVALYCYESVDLPRSAIVVFQPLHFPAPVVSLPENRSRCYHRPALIKAVTENYGSVAGNGRTSYGSYAIPAASDTCGVAYLYHSCNGDGQLVVTNSGSPTVYYGGKCWTDPQVVTEFGADIQVVAGASTLPVSSCLDVLCTGSDANGATVGYVDGQFGHSVDVQFDHLGYGIPHFGVCLEKVDDGEGGLTPGSATLAFYPGKTSTTLIQHVAGAGRIEFTTELPEAKRIIVWRGGHSLVYNLSPGKNKVFLNVEEGDRIDIGVAKPLRYGCGYATWKSAPLGLRKYDQAVLDYNGTTAIRAVGFCGLAARSGYAFYGSLPSVAASPIPNPDTYVTVKGANSKEFVLVTSRSAGDQVPSGPGGTEPYAGQRLAGPLTFSFYTGRGAAGAHGEMDVWLETPGQFPEVLAAGHYSALVRPHNWYRKAAPGTVRRSSLTVAQDGQSYRLPGVYASAEGDILVTGGDYRESITNNGTHFALSGTAYGLAHTIK